MEILLKILAPFVNFYGAEFSSKSIFYFGSTGGPNLFIRLVLAMLCISLIGSMLFYFLGRYFNIKKNWHWVLWFILLSSLFSYFMFAQVYNYVWFGDKSMAVDIDYALIFSPLFWLFVFYCLFSKLWLSIPNFTIFAIRNPSFLVNKSKK